MKRQPLESSIIRSVGYDKGSRTLEIEFMGGEVYQYHQVPEDIYERLMKASSHGKYFLEEIRGMYPYKKVGETTT